ncbi:MAG: hypothetical protein JWP89_5620 [Schlesneria sp.]|nr:hypothetical protein [Schlesneria sp.]
MAKRTGWYVLMAMAATLWWQSSCSAQAFFPLLRVDDMVWDTKVHVVLESSTTDSVDVVDPVNDTNDSTDHDTNFTIVNEITSAVAGNSNAESNAIAEAEILPAASSWMMLGQCISSIGGLWDLNTSSSGYAAIVNNQCSRACGRFEILENSSSPSTTLGTMQVTFTIDFNSVDWDEGEIHMSCNGAFVDLTYADGFYTVEGNLAGNGNIEDSGVASGPVVFTAFMDVEVGDVFCAKSKVSGSKTESVFFTDSDSAIPSLSVNTSFYVSER